ncbi:MAG: IS5 family transposase [Bacteroidales bacterium]|nr:IS5 family transposase [Bacteroidales bacterium]
MINYTSQNQLSLAGFSHPFERDLSAENRWVKLAKVIPWDELAAVYSSKLQSGSGRNTVDVRTVIAALIVKHKLMLDDRGTVEMIQENIYIQYFCGFKSFTTKRAFDPSLFVDIRKRLGGEEFDRFNKLVIERAEQLKPHQSRIKRKGSGNDTDQLGASAKPNRGTLKADATIADQEIRFPTDLNLLSISRENLERMIDLLYDAKRGKQKPRDYRRKARKEYMNLSKKRRKGKKTLRRGIKAQLQFVARDLRIIKSLMENSGREDKLSKRDSELLDVITKVHEQQRWMYDNKKNSVPDRIVNIFQPWVRPMVRGKDKNKTEFGSKMDVSEVDGFCRLDRFSWDAFNEGGDVELLVENFRKLYGCYPKSFLGDGIYMNRKARMFLKEKGIEIYGKPLGRPPKRTQQTSSQKYRKKKKAAQRNHIEGKFGQGKRGYGLNNVKARLKETSESWINAIFFVMNLTKLLQIAEKHPGFFVLFLETFKKMQIGYKNYFVIKNLAHSKRIVQCAA